MLAPQLIECDREVNVLHLSGKRVAKRLAETGRPIDIPVTPGNKQRRKKRKSLDMIPVRVTEQDAATQRSSGLSQHRSAKVMRASAAIDDHQGAFWGGHLNAGGVATITNCVSPGSGKRAPGSPELDLHTRRINAHSA